MAFMVSIGQAPENTRAKDKGPECPLIFMGLFETYRSLKFVQRTTDDTVKLYPRDMITWTDLDAFQRSTRQSLSILDVELITGLDAIFEGRNDG